MRGMLRGVRWPSVGRGVRACLALVALSGFGVAQGCGLDTSLDQPSPSGACSVAAHCDDGNPCTEEVCDASGVCVGAPLADGPAPLQVPGDCQQNVCAAGQLVQAPDEADVFDDGLPCTVDACEDGAPAHTQLPFGTPCESVDGSAFGECGSGGTCVFDCSAGEPCPDDGNPCTEDICDVSSGTCLASPMDGVLVPGDPQDVACRSRMCVAGVVVDVVDDAHLPVTANDCDTETCNGGVPANDPLAPGTPCSAGVCNNGVCVECIDPELHCTMLPPTNECGVRACNAGVCEFETQADGTVLTDLVDGDCHRRVCMSGEVTTPIDPTDVLFDNNPCTQDLCTNGVAENPPEPANTSCGGTLVCDGNGVCQACTQASQCPADPVNSAAAFCRVPVCTTGSCGYSPINEGVALPAQHQTAGNCDELRCQNGSPTSVPLPSDLPAEDGNACTQSACSPGPVQQNLPTTQACTQANNQPGFCNGAGACVQCNDVTQCGADVTGACSFPQCVSNACVVTNIGAGQPAEASAQTPNDCKLVVCDGAGSPSAAPAADNDPPLPDANPCTTATCSGTTPVQQPVSAGTSCGVGLVCTAGAECKDANGQPCSTTAECASGNCVDATCCSVAACGECQACTGANGTCQNLNNTTDPDNCAAPNQCIAGDCKLPNGGACSLGAECISGFCADGVCCNTACGGLCQACTAALKGSGASGTCGSIAAGADPQNECAAGACVTGACNGSGACGQVANGTSCGMASCTSGTEYDAPTCQAGVCTNDPTPTLCSPYVCDAGAPACLDACVSAADCVSSAYYCDVATGDCLLEKANGLACDDGVECTSGFCVDGVCCSTACDALCLSCTAALKGSGADGSCGPTGAGQESDNECPGIPTCNGAGACG